MALALMGGKRPFSTSSQALTSGSIALMIAAVTAARIGGRRHVSFSELGTEEIRARMFQEPHLQAASFEKGCTPLK